MSRDPLEGIRPSDINTRTTGTSMSPVRGGPGRSTVMLAALLFGVMAAVTVGALVFFASTPSTTGGTQAGAPTSTPAPVASPLATPTVAPTLSPPPPPPVPNEPAPAQHE